jgi:hypothetical protein
VCRVVWYKFTDVSEVCTASVIRAMSGKSRPSQLLGRTSGLGEGGYWVEDRERKETNWRRSGKIESWKQIRTYNM